MKVALALLLVALIASVSANDTCDMFAIRNRGNTLFYIDSSNGVLGIPHDLDVGSVQTSQIILGDYLLNVYPTDSGEKLGIRKRLSDDATGKYKVPRSVLAFALDGTHVIYNDEIRDVSEFTLYELRDYLRLARADELALEGHNDPFNMQWGFNGAGEFCKDGPDCVSTVDDLFEEITLSSSPAARDALVELLDLTEEYPQAGDDGYEGSVQSITFETVDTADRRRYEGERVVNVYNEDGKTYGEAGFRLADDEVEDVFVLQAENVGEWELTPGFKVPVIGWRGGQVYDFEFGPDGSLAGGHVIVGPFPETDENDIVEYSNADGWSGLEAQVPGPALRLGFLRNTRIYVSSVAPDAESEDEMPTVTPAWLGLDVPHDQSAIPVESPVVDATKREVGDNTVVFEFVVHNVGTHLYSTWEFPGSSNSGPIVIDYPNSDMTADREYVVYLGAVDEYPVLNGNTFPGTGRRLSGWFRDVMAIESSVPGEDEDGNPGTIVTIRNQARPPVAGGNSDALRPAVAYECPAYGGPILGRAGTGCGSGADHEHDSHQITSTTLNPGHQVEIWDHLDFVDEQSASINGHHFVKRVDATSFFIPLIGTNGTKGGEGGYVGIWRLHKADPERPALQNNGVSGGYFRFNYGEKIHMRFVNSLGTPIPLHIHGHQWALWAEDGNLLDYPFAQQEVTVPGGSTVDVLVVANNPNRYGSWLLSATEPEYLTFSEHPWLDAPTNPGGLMAYVDYTGDRQGALAVDENMIVRSFWELPPQCTVEQGNIDLYRDHRGFGYHSTQYLELEGDAFWVNAPYDFVTLDGDVEYSWNLVEGPASAQVIAFESEADQDRIRHFYGFDVAGEYTFVFRAEGHLSNRGADEFNACEVRVVVTVPEDEVSSEDVEILYNPFSVHIAPADDSEDENGVGEIGRGYPRGQATFTLREASARFAEEQSVLETSYWRLDTYNSDDWFDINAEDEFDDGGVTFYRWPTTGNDDEHPDYWLDVEFDLKRTESQYRWALKRAVFDTRVETYGFVLGTDLGNDVDEGEMGPEVSRVVYPLWQGASTSGGSFNSRHDVYFLILQASDEEFCEMYGCVYTPALSSTPVEALNEVSLYRAQGQPSVKNANLANRANTGTFAQDRATDFLFETDPGNVPTVDPDTQIGADYSPLKVFRFVGRDGVSRSVVANMPFVYWGLYRVQTDGDLPTAEALRLERKMLLVDEVLEDAEDDQIYCNPYARVYPINVAGVDDWHEDNDPSDRTSGFWGATQDDRTGTNPAWGGPPGCEWQNGRETSFPGERGLGGQLLDVPNFRKMYAIFKLHRALASSVDATAYYSVTDTTDYAAAQFYGIIWAPKLANAGRPSEDNAAVVTFSHFGNGVMQDGVLPALPGSDDFSSLWHVTYLYWNCGTLEFFLPDSMEAETYIYSDVIGPSGDWRSPLNLLNVDDGFIYPSLENAPADFYPLAAGIKGTYCPHYVASQTGRANGMLYPAEKAALIEAGVLLETEYPPGSETVSDDNEGGVIVNAHVPVLFYYNAHVNKEDWVPSVEDLPDYDDYRLAEDREVNADEFEEFEDNYPDNSPVGVYLPGTWGLLYREYDTNIPLGSPTGYNEILALYFPPVDTEDNEGYWHYPSLWSHLPPEAVRGSPSTGPQWIQNLDFDLEASYDDGVTDANDPVFLLDLEDLLDWETNQDILYAIVECDDAEFAELAGAAFTPALAFFDNRATTWASYWSEPEVSADGEIDAEEFEESLRTFIFYESPPDVPFGLEDVAVAERYTAFKRFTFRHRTVTCNMPFYSWGEDSDESMVMAEADCSTGDCVPALDSGSGQVLEANTDRRDESVATLNDLDFTVKLHRAVRYDDGVYPYFAVFDVTDDDWANYLGVPVSLRVRWANRASIENGVTTMHIISGGPPCPGCWDLDEEINGQEPIAPPSAGEGGLVTPLHQFLLVDATEATYDDAVDDGVLVREEGDAKVVFHEEIEAMIDGNYWDVQGDDQDDLSFGNTPFIAQVTYPMPEDEGEVPTPNDVSGWADRKENGETHIFLATRTSLAWRLIEGTPNSEYEADEISIVDSRWFPAEGEDEDISTDFGDLEATVLFVSPGDRVVFYILGDNTITPHGFVAGMEGEDRDSEEDFWNFFEAADLEFADFDFDYATEERLVSVYGSEPYGFTGYEFGPFTLFDGYVREVRAGTVLYVTSSIYGPQRMSIALVVADYE